ncbi:PilZ domain-containing protein [Marinobacterium jannaschii]|uniref:PilZ domain-containing protein n=1 Tax=Marinobacterium jannaschii TaxID=64970 RepID=UPI000480BEF0|nr:PilZ domain-containing protein [Marinobacterium jannaschii]
MQEQDRRKYFRIEQKVSIELKPVTEEEIADNPRPAQFEVSPYFTLLSQLQELDQESHSLLRKIAERDANVAAFLHILHSKIETIAKTVASSGFEVDQVSTQEVNLSEGGLMFENEVALDMDKHVAVKLIFQESCIGLLLYAKVCRIIPLDNGKFNVGLEFVSLPENCRQILARQVFAAQTHARQIELHALADE